MPTLDTTVIRCGNCGAPVDPTLSVIRCGHCRVTTIVPSQPVQRPRAVVNDVPSPLAHSPMRISLD